MAITPINNRYPGFIFDGENSRDYGVYITDVEVFGAPKRKVQMISIPGRNGDYALDEGSFENITVKYECVLGAGSESDFNDGISDFRNWLASKVGYKTLSDEINTGEFRKAVFIDGMEVPTLNKKTGTFDVLFDCKPQRFLKSGEIPRTIGGAVTNTQTKSGTVISIDSDGGDKATSLIATIEAVQDGSGDPSPNNVRPITGWGDVRVSVNGANFVENKVTGTQTTGGITLTANSDGSITLNGTSDSQKIPISNFATGNITSSTQNDGKKHIPNGTWTVKPTGNSGIRLQVAASNNASGTSGLVLLFNAASGSFTIDDTYAYNWVRLYFNSGLTLNDYTVYPMIVKSGESTDDYKPYDGETHTINLSGTAGTVYGGELNVTTGVLTLTHKAETFNGSEPWGKETSSAGLTNFYLNLDVAGKMAGRQGGLLDDELLCNWLAPSSSITTYSVYVGTSGTYLNAKCSSASDVAAFKSMLSATPLVVVYPLETPQTYTLTAQEVSLLTGNNNVWADTGDISITYGRDPNVLVNPTLFESNPLIELVGYGGVDFNGTPITVYNYTLGDIELTAAETHGFVDEQFRITNTATYTFETAFLNPGDPVYMQGGEFLFKFYTTSKVWVQSWSSDGFIGTPTDGTYITPSVPKNPTNAGNWTSNTFYIHANITNTVSFVYGTATTINDTAALSVEYRDRDSITHTSNFDISFTATYNGGGTVAVSITTTSVGSQCEENSYPYDNMHFAAFSTFSATSSYAPSDLFIDSDIGEAYFLQSGAAISANDYIYMNELPTLKPGANMITYDNTITDFQVVPRWWKV